MALKRSTMKSASGTASGKAQPCFRNVQTVDGKWRKFGHRFQIVTEDLLCLSALDAPAQLADGHHGLGVERQPNRAIVRVSFAIDAMHGLEDRVGLRNFAQRLAFCHPPGFKAQRAEFAPQAAF